MGAADAEGLFLCLRERVIEAVEMGASRREAAGPRVVAYGCPAHGRARCDVVALQPVNHRKRSTAVRRSPKRNKAASFNDPSDAAHNYGRVAAAQ